MHTGIVMLEHDLGLFVPVKGNYDSTAHKYILHNSVPCVNNLEKRQRYDCDGQVFAHCWPHSEYQCERTGAIYHVCFTFASHF